jgi:hypothetical protein
MSPFCAGFGQYDTHSITLSSGKQNTAALAGQPYTSVTEADILAMAANPPSIHKDDAQWFIPSDYLAHDGREHDAQRQHGQFWAIPLDLDANSPPLAVVRAALAGVVGNAGRVIYSSRSAKADNLKWRALCWLETPIAGADYADTVEAFNDLIADQLEPDRALQRTGQLIFLPNRGEYYESEVHDGPRTSLTPNHPIIVRREQTRRSRADAEAKAAAWKAALTPSDAANVVDAFNETHVVSDLLDRYGYEQARDSNNWKSPMQSGGSFATRDYGDYWISLSGSDSAAGIGQDTKTGQRFGDAFDLFVHFEHAGDFNVAVRTFGALHRLTNMPGPSHVPVGMMPTAPVQGMPTAPRAASVVDLICERIKDNPTTAVALLAEEVARLSHADRDTVLAECKPHGIKVKMQAAVKRAVTAFLAAKGAVALQTPEYAELSYYFIVRNEDGQAVAVDARGGMQPQTRTQFRDAMAQLPPIMIEDKATGNVRAKLAADYWWEHPDTLSYHATGYNPLEGVELYDDKARKIRNVYEPGHTAPAAPVGPEAVEPFLHVIRSNFPDAADQSTLLQILAHLVQRPGVMLRWAPVMQGTPGCGKGTISQAVAYCHGRKNVAHPSPDVIATDFNGYMHQKTLIVVNEIGDHSKRELSVLAEKIKPWITDDDAHIHGKGKGSFDTQNFTNWIFTTNHLHCMLATPGERRYAHFISALQTEEDAARALYPEWWTGSTGDWWGSYYDWWGAGGAEAVRGYLGHLALDVVPSRAPVTSSTAEAMHAGDGAAAGLIRSAVTEGAVGFRGGWVSLNAVRDLLESEDLKVPGGPYLARQLEQIGYRHTTRCNTSPSEARRFPKAPNRCRLYHIEDHTGTDPASIMAMYDAAQRLGDGDPVRSTVIKMTGL